MLSALNESLAVCRLDARAKVSVPEDSPFFSVTRTADEVSIVCSEKDAPEGATVEGGWRAMKVEGTEGTLDFSMIGVLASISAPLADAGIPVFVVSTYETDYIFVKEETFERAKSVLSDAGHEFVEAPNIRPATSEDEGFMRRMLAVAAHAEDEAVAFEDPEISRYLDGWGRDGDVGFVAESVSGEPLGAAWARLFTIHEPAYGFVDEETPEMAVGVRADARSRGVGLAVISHLVSEVGERFSFLSLSVREDNPAIRLYRRLGFEVVGETGSHAEGKSLTMKLDLR